MNPAAIAPFAAPAWARGPTPFEALPAQLLAGVALDVVVAASPAHPSNQLSIERRIDGRERTPVRAWPETGAAAPDGAQRFRARLPALAAGEAAEYTPVLRRAGLVVAMLPSRAVRTAPADAPAADTAPAPPATALPRYQWASEFLGAFTAQLAKPPESFGPVPDGLRITFYIASGGIRGPRLNAVVRPEGGDWMLVRRDGVGMCDVRITYETDDGALLLSRYYGVFDLGPHGYERALRNDYDALPPLVLAPQFVTSHRDWLWLNRLQCVAVGRVDMAALLVRFDLYALRAGQPLASSGLARAQGAAPLVGDIHG